MPSPVDPPAREEPSTLDAFDDDLLSDAELGVLLDPDVPLEGDAYDTEDSSDLDIGRQTDEIESGSDEELGTIELGSDADELLPIDDGGSDADDGDETDPSSFEPLPSAGELAPGDEADGPGFEASLTDLDVPALPALDEDDGDGELTAEKLPTAWLAGDEPRPRASATPWAELASSLALEACSALAVADGVVVAASTDLLWFAPGGLTPLRLEAGSARISSLALTKPGWEYAVCATTSGRLLRRGRLAAASEELRGLREILPGGGPGPELFELCQPGSAFPHAILARSDSGALLRSDDDGLTFRRVTNLRIHALSVRGAPVLALTADARLLRSDDGGGSFREIALPPSVREIATSEAPLVAGHGSIVVLGEPSLGIALSRDGGASFDHIPGTWGVTALSAGELEGKPRAWAALNDDADRTHVIGIDPASAQAETIALLEYAESEEDETLSLARVARIEWEPVHRRLWLVGGFGVKVYTPPERLSGGKPTPGSPRK